MPARADAGVGRPPETWHHLRRAEAGVPCLTSLLSPGSRPSRLVHRLTALAAAAVLTATAAAAQPAAPVLQAQAFGQTIVASWTSVPGAASYLAEAGITPTQVLGAYEMGPLTGFSINAPQGTYYLRVFARDAQGVLSAPSNIVAITVTSSLAPPPPPTNFAASASGSTVNFSVTLPPVPLSGLVLAAGIAPGQTLGIMPLPVASQGALPNVPPGTYFARLHALGPGGPSAASNEVQITVSPSGGCLTPSAPSVTAQVAGTSVAVSWTAVSGAAGYQLAASTSPGGPPMATQQFPANVTSAGYNGVPPGTYYIAITAANDCGGTATSAPATAVVTGGGGGTSGPRTPNPPSPTPPNYLPLPNRAAVVEEMARLYPGDLRNSCVEHGGNNRWLFRLVERLRREDTRWGLNWKRARVGDMSQDVVTYNYGPQDDEGTLFVHVVDVIGGHCGSNPGPTWINQTILWSTGAKWTLQPYLQAGYPQFPQ
jgi:hypothetical protein